VLPTFLPNACGWYWIKMLGSFHEDSRSKHFRTFIVVGYRDTCNAFSNVVNLCFVEVSMRQQQQNQNRKKQPANLPKTVSRVRFSFLFTRIISGNHEITSNLGDTKT